MSTATKAPPKVFNKQYNVAIDTSPLPDEQEDRVQFVVDLITPTIKQIVKDAMSVAIGTWPTPEKPKKL